MELLRERSSERFVNGLEVCKPTVGDYRRVISSEKCLRTTPQEYTPTILEVIGLGLAPYAQLLADSFCVFGNFIVVDYGVLGGRGQPLARSSRAR